MRFFFDFETLTRTELPSCFTNLGQWGNTSAGRNSISGRNFRLGILACFSGRNFRLVFYRPEFQAEIFQARSNPACLMQALGTIMDKKSAIYSMRSIGSLLIIFAWNSGLKFWLGILAWNSRPEFSACFFQARIPGRNFGLET